ncbi:hypothetical protein [Mycobacterium colombiense]|uniref:hypothetical protein n=1 Tax=Mycobacterium colombiense TaxID=339268 RepID=UPI001057E23D|nr:hypothetical protein [Mycobacterium colombiense]
MSTVGIREHAQMFHWDCHQEFRRDTLVCGQHMVAIDYRRDGTIEEGRRYTFQKITDVKLQERTGPRHKRATIVSWLVNLGK